MTQTLFDNAAWAKAKPKLSVLIPFKGDDACDLLRALDEEQAAAEIVILDDGSSDPCLTSRVQATMAAMRLPVRLVTLAKNEGRACGRIRLASHARAARQRRFPRALDRRRRRAHRVRRLFHGPHAVHP